MKKLWKYLLVIAALVAIDQVTKILVVQNIALGTQIPVIPNLFSLTYTRNEGAAWSLFAGQQWLFALVFVGFTALLLWEFFKKQLPFTPLERWLLVFIYAGGLGNMIDRVRLEYVVDMIQTDFMDFPVFNVADCFISCGCVLLVIHLVFFNKQFWKDGKK
ncbi:MAG: signal peptidase II [Ruminococcaceae bacterium]|nr:signal peptidase II [Oscillospiraceae bacterium]